MLTLAPSPSYANQRPRRHPSLWDVLTVFSGCAALGNAWAAAQLRGISPAAKPVSVLVGVVLGVACIYVIRTLPLVARPTDATDKSYSFRGLVVWLLYPIATLWIFASGVLGFVATRAVLELLGL